MEKLVQWNQAGLIPGPEESDVDFVKRASRAQLEPVLEELRPAFDKISACYDVLPSWIPITYSNKGLLPWHGGVMDPAKGLQLRTAFRKKGRYLALYSREEIVAHELVHAGRFAFDEPQYEELFAYQTSASFLRQWIGPMIERPYEVWLFLASILLPLMGDYTCLAFGYWEGFRFLMPLKVLPGILISLGFVRHLNKKRRLRRLLKELEKITDFPQAVAYRLSDGEIGRFSKMEGEGIRQELERGAGIRFEMIRACYL